MRTKGIAAKIWLSIGILATGFLILLLVLQVAGANMQAQLEEASGSLFPAALSCQQAQAAFQRMTKRYNDAVLLQDKKILQSADQDAQAVVASLEQIRGWSRQDESRKK